MGKENQRVMVTKKLLKEGLLRILENKTIDKISVTELCRESGINRATFYTHYEIPRDILIEIEHDVIHTLADLYNRKPQNVYTAMEAMVQYYYAHADLIRILIREFSDRDLAAMLQEVYQNTINTSVFKNADEDDIKLMSAYIAGGGYYLLSTWLKEDIQKTPQEVTQLIIRLIPENLLLKS